MKSENYGTWLEIDLSILEKNFLILSRFLKKPIMPVIKANAYGHGLIRVAECFEKSGANWLGVARIEEGLMLREAGIKSNILVLGYTSPARIPHAIKERISLSVYDFGVADQYGEIAARLSKRISVHAIIDTGMGRLGVLPEQATEFLKRIIGNRGLNLEGVFSHFARADEPGNGTTIIQIQKFQEVLKQFKQFKDQSPLIHCANSAGALLFQEARLDIVRVGIALYGLAPSNQVDLPLGIQPALSWKTRLISRKALPAGHGVSYGHQYVTQKEEQIGVIAVGYGDGLRRQSGNEVLISGKRMPIIGNICMDQSMVNLEQNPDADIGDEVVIIGQQGENIITASELADKWGTINYEVVCGLASRMPYYYQSQR